MFMLKRNHLPVLKGFDFGRVILADENNSVQFFVFKKNQANF